MLSLFPVKHSGNLAFEEIINIAKVMRPRSIARTMEGTVKEILGSSQVRMLFIFHNLSTIIFLFCVGY